MAEIAIEVSRIGLRNTNMEADEMETAVRFNGPDYVPERDNARLSVQLERIFDLMKDGVPRTLGEIEAATGDPQASISAQLRHLRKPRFGGHVVEKEYLGGGLYKYTLRVNYGPVP